MYSERKGYVHCGARLRVVFPNSNDSVVVERCVTVDHDHSKSDEPPALTPEVKKEMARLADGGARPKRIHFLISVVARQHYLE